MKFLVGENGRNLVKNLPRPRFVHHEPHMEGPRCELGTPAVGGERLAACATRPPEQTYMYAIVVIGPFGTSECAGEYRFSVNLSKRALDVTAGVIVEATRNADMLTINASEDFQ